MSTLDAAYEELQARSRAADEAGDWAERSVLDGLVDVADYLRRVADHPHSRYRADKAGPLLAAAVSLQREVFLAYAAWPDEDSTSAGRLIVESTKVLAEACDAVRRVLWRAAEAELHGETVAVYQSTAREVTGAAAAFGRWASSVAADARPDPEGGW